MHESLRRCAPTEKDHEGAEAEEEEVDIHNPSKGWGTFGPELAEQDDSIEEDQKPEERTRNGHQRRR